jgi:protein-tyrosine phosphatase
VLILCHGNVCRSPYAEVKLRGLLAERGWADTLVESAGFIGPGRPANDSAQRTATARHVDLTGHRSRLVNPTMAEAASLLIVMTTAQARDANQEFGVAWTRIEILGDLDPASIGERDIPDPYGKPSEVFERVFDRIDRCLEALVGAWGP